MIIKNFVIILLGVIIMGSLEGTRIWMKEIKNKVLTNIEVLPNNIWLNFSIKQAIIIHLQTL